jgi:hypothetical protein
MKLHLTMSLPDRQSDVMSRNRIPGAPAWPRRQQHDFAQDATHTTYGICHSR